MSTNTALGDIKARVEGHTPGPWKAWNDAPAHRSAYVETTWSTDSEHTEQITDGCCPADAELIAVAPKLLAALEAVEALHYVAEGYSVPLCNECRGAYPCPTLTAIADALA